ncbi:MAG: PAS domain-containing protein, partial [Desulfobacterales bacterium]|nr:PAS domain-containing protein [Desulfobacterales bacterium]
AVHKQAIKQELASPQRRFGTHKHILPKLFQIPLLPSRLRLRVRYTVRYKKNPFPRTRSVVGRKVEKCHPDQSVEMVRRIVTGFKNRTMDKAEFWIDFRGDKVLIRYFPVYGDQGEYLGVLEVTQAIGWIRRIKGQKRLMD